MLFSAGGIRWKSNLLNEAIHFVTKKTNKRFGLFLKWYPIIFHLSVMMVSIEILRSTCNSTPGETLCETSLRSQKTEKLNILKYESKSQKACMKSDQKTSEK